MPGRLTRYVLFGVNSEQGILLRDDATQHLVNGRQPMNTKEQQTWNVDPMLG